MAATDQKVIALIADSAMKPGVHIDANSMLEDDLGMESLDRIEVFTALHNEFGVYIPDNIAATAVTVGDVCKIIERAVKPN